MSTEVDPVVDSWYLRSDTQQRFEVVDIDEESHLIAIQYFDGDVDEVDLDEWYDWEIEPIEPPEDWTATADMERDDLGYTETVMEEHDWKEPGRRPPEEEEHTTRWEEEGEEGEE